MPGKKLHPGFLICVIVGLLLIGFALLGSFLATAEADGMDPNMPQIQIQLQMCLNLILSGLAFIVIGVGCQLMAGTNTAPQTPLGTGGWQQQPVPPQQPAGGQYYAPQQAAAPGQAPMQQAPMQQQPPQQ